MKRVEDGIPTDAGEDGRRMLAKDADRLCLVCRVTTTKLCNSPSWRQCDRLAVSSARPQP